MKYEVKKISPDMFKYIKFSYVQNGEIDIKNMVNNYINALKKRGYTNEQIDAMNITIYYTN